MVNFIPQRNFAPEIGGNGGEVNPEVADTVGGTIDNVGGLVELSQEVQADIESRRKVWHEIATEQGLNESHVKITENGIEIENVGIFELNDRKKSSFNDLDDKSKGLLPTQSNWHHLRMFVYTQLGRHDGIKFVLEVMNIKGGRYISQTSYRGLVDGVLIDTSQNGRDWIQMFKNGDGFYNDTICAVRLMKN